MVMLDIKTEMAAIDTKDREFYNKLSGEDKKKLSLFVLIRWASLVNSNNAEVDEYYVLATNENVNKNFFNLPRNTDELQWLALTTVSPDIGNVYHYWQSAPKRKTVKTKMGKLLARLFPDVRADELALLESINDKKSIIEYAEHNGLSEEEIKSLLK